MGEGGHVWVWAVAAERADYAEVGLSLLPKGSLTLEPPPLSAR